jgi:hypothetical protein
MLKTVEMVKGNMGKQKRYETEILRLSEDIDDLRSLASRLISLVGLPSDGIKYDLFNVDVAEDRFLELEDSLKADLIPRVARTEATIVDLDKDIKFFKKNIGANVTSCLQDIESSVKAYKVTAAAGAGFNMGQIQKLLIDEIMPALRDLWDFYIMVTKGPGQALRPGSGERAGAVIYSRIEALEATAGSNGGANGFEQRLSR